MNKLMTIFFLLSVGFCSLLSCENESNEQAVNLNSESNQVKKESSGDTTIIVGGVEVDIVYPNTTVRGTILCLPGWDFSRKDLCQRGNFCSLARDSGYILIMPEMGKSVYHSRIYPETREDWRKYPTLRWLTDTLIPFMQKEFILLVKGENNFVFGISTGGRGVAQIATHTSGIFRAGAAFSGDFDQRKMKKDNLMRGYYGEYQKFKERWEGDDNPVVQAKRIDFPIFLSHGKFDKVVPYEQSKFLFDAIHDNGKIGGLSPGIAPFDTCGHGYPFWNSESIFAFNMFYVNQVALKDSVWRIK